jgi:hypothetical protein
MNFNKAIELTVGCDSKDEFFNLINFLGIDERYSDGMYDTISTSIDINHIKDSFISMVESNLFFKNEDEIIDKIKSIFNNIEEENKILNIFDYKQELINLLIIKTLSLDEVKELNSIINMSFEIIKENMLLSMELSNNGISTLNISFSYWS